MIKNDLKKDIFKKRAFKCRLIPSISAEKLSHSFAGKRSLTLAHRQLASGSDTDLHLALCLHSTPCSSEGTGAAVQCWELLKRVEVLLLFDGVTA